MGRDERWHLNVPLPGRLEGGLGRTGDRLGLTRSGLVALVLTRAAGQRLAELEARFELGRSVRASRIDRAFQLLTRALQVPVRPEGIYPAAEMAAYLGIRETLLRAWVVRGLIKVTETDGFVFVRGAEMLRLLLEESRAYLRAVAVVQAAPAGPQGAK